jgi:hypothetical protein
VIVVFFASHGIRPLSFLIQGRGKPANPESIPDNIPESTAIGIRW